MQLDREIWRGGFVMAYCFETLDVLGVARYLKAAKGGYSGHELHWLTNTLLPEGLDPARDDRARQIAGLLVLYGAIRVKPAIFRPFLFARGTQRVHFHPFGRAAMHAPILAELLPAIPRDALHRKYPHPGLKDDMQLSDHAAVAHNAGALELLLGAGARIPTRIPPEPYCNRPLERFRNSLARTRGVVTAFVRGHPLREYLPEDLVLLVLRLV